MNFEVIFNMSKVPLVILEITLKQICCKFIKKIFELLDQVLDFLYLPATRG